MGKRTETSGFAVIRLAASPTNRAVVAQAFINGELVASGSAADNYLANVISCTTQTLTVPVPKHAKLTIVAPTGGSGVTALWFPNLGFG